MSLMNLKKGLFLCLFRILELNHLIHMEYIYDPLMNTHSIEGQKSVRFHEKYLHSHFEDEG